MSTDTQMIDAMQASKVYIEMLDCSILYDVEAEAWVVGIYSGTKHVSDTSVETLREALELVTARTAS